MKSEDKPGDGELEGCDYSNGDCRDGDIGGSVAPVC